MIPHWLAHTPWTVWYVLWHALGADGGHALVAAGHYGAVGVAATGAATARVLGRRRKRRKSVENVERYDDEDRWQWWLVLDGGQPHMVTKHEWVQAERAHGFRVSYRTSDPDAPATMSWSAGRSRGFRIRK